MIRPIIEHKIWADTAIKCAWCAITETEQIKQWWGASGYAEIDTLAANARIRFNTKDGPIFATIRCVNPPYELVYDWPPHPRYFSVPFTTRYLLQEENDGTWIALSESGFDAWPDDEVCRERFERLDAGFGMLLENLKAYLEKRELPHLF